MDLTKPLLSPNKANKNSSGQASEAARGTIPEGQGAKIPGPAAALGLAPQNNHVMQPSAYGAIPNVQDALSGKAVAGGVNATRLDGFASNGTGDKGYGLPRDRDNAAYPRVEGSGRLGLDSGTNALTINKRLPKEETV